MKLTRRDALLAVSAGGSAAVFGTFGPMKSLTQPRAEATELADAEVRTLVATAEVVYPSAVSGIDTFVRNYIGGLSESRQRTVASVTDELRSHIKETQGRDFPELSVGKRDSALRTLGVSRVGSDAGGTLPERVRYYVVNQLLYGLYSSPTGSRLVGIRNPVGHPGGYKSYQEAPERSQSDAN